MMVESVRNTAIRKFLARPEIGRRRISREAFTRYNAAFTHRSYARDSDPEGEAADDNERLEFLGDRVLNLVIADFLYSGYNEQEGYLTVRMEWTKNHNIASVMSSRFPEFPGLIMVGHNQMVTPRIIAGTFEAFIGAFYLDAGLEAVKKMIISSFGENIREFPTETNFKKRLQEYLQKRGFPLPVYDLEKREGKPHLPYFSFIVRSGDVVLGKGTGRSKSEATQLAAQNAIEKLAKRNG